MSKLATIPEARVATEIGTGEILVGDSTGVIYAINSFGDVAEIARLPSPAVQLTGGPSGEYWTLSEDSSLWLASRWSEPQPKPSPASAIAISCDGVFLHGAASAVGIGGTCDDWRLGTFSGEVGGESVSVGAIRRVVAVGDGNFWVDEHGRTGCVDCSSPVPDEGVRDAIPLHVPPLIPGEWLWIDWEGALWVR